MRQAQGFREGSTDSGARVFKIGERVYRLRAGGGVDLGMRVFSIFKCSCEGSEAKFCRFHSHSTEAGESISKGLGSEGVQVYRVSVYGFRVRAYRVNGK